MKISKYILEKFPVKYLTMIKNTFWSLSGQLFPLLAAVICIPILLQNIGAERFGFLSIAWMFIGYFSLFDFGLGRALTFIVAKNNAQKIDSSGIINTSLKFMLVVSLIITAIFFFILSEMSLQVLRVSEDIIGEAGGALKILSLGLPFVIISIGLKGILEANFAFREISFITIPSGILLFLLPAILSYYSNDLRIIFLSLVIIRLVQVLFLYVKAKLYFVILPVRSFDVEEIKVLLKFGSWMTITNVISPIMVNMDRFFIGVKLAVSSVAYYVVPFDMITKALILPSAISAVFFPEFSKEISKGNLKNVRLLLLKAMIVLSAFMFLPLLIIWYFSYDILSIWISEEFSDKSYYILKILCVGVFFNALAYLPFSFIQGGGRSDITAKIHMLEIVIYLPFMLYMLEALGLEGAAYAWTLRVFVDMLLMSAVAYSWKKL